ncbi:MAG: PKD domain-containing protein [Chloroflexi bacterium]|nr:PKD domain-containing protein [Chloroflexota bacterium]
MSRTRSIGCPGYSLFFWLRWPFDKRFCSSLISRGGFSRGGASRILTGLLLATLIFVPLLSVLPSGDVVSADSPVTPMVAAGYNHTVGLKSDGTVVAVGYNQFGQCNVGSWSGIQQVAAGYDYTVGLKSDGTVVAAGLEIELAKWNLGTATPNQPPIQPSNVSPSSAATGVSLMPTLQSSTFSDPDISDTHAASQWQIRTGAGSYNSPVYDNVTGTPNLTSISVPSGKLTYSTAYCWRVRYQDNHGDWSTWSAETSFTTKADSVVSFPDPNLEAAIREAIGKPAGDIYESDLVGLTDFDAHECGITNLAGLAHCTSLTSLGLWDNQISDISPLSGLTSLEYLELSGNQISDISPLSGLTNLTALNLGANQISDIEPLVSNPGIASGDTVNLPGNPLNSNSINTCIPALQGRGVTVSWDTANQSPKQPSNVSPANGATGVSLTTTLQSSASSDPDAGDTHAASQWQVRTSSGSYSSPAFGSGSDTSNLTSITVPSGKLTYSTTYYWHVRYQDNQGDWSDWSAETTFITGNAPQLVNLDVRFITQFPPGDNWTETKNCGQASSLMVFCYWNGTVPTEQGIKDIDDWLYTKYGDPVDNYNGYFTDHTGKRLEALAQGYGGFTYSYETDRWDIAKVKQEIGKGHPVIVAVAGKLTGDYLGNDAAWHTIDRDYSANGHWLVVTGYSDTDIICNDPGTSYGHKIYYGNDEFSNAMWGWEDSSGWDGAACVVVPSPVANAGADQSVSSGDVVSFDASGSHDPDGTIATYQWDFGDGATQTGKEVSHRFRGAANQPKTYTATLTVTDSSGATATDTVGIAVKPLEKSVEISDPPVLARATFTYNWIEQSGGDDIYMISKLDVEAEGFVGVFVPNIVVWQYQYPIGVMPVIDFLDYLSTWGPHTEQVYQSPFSLKSPIGIFSGNTTRTFDEGTFQGIQVKGTDTVNIVLQGFTAKLGWPPIETKLFSFRSEPVDPHVGPVEPSLTQQILEKLLEAVTGKLDAVIIHSPGEIRVYDSQGRVAGVVNGETKLDIPGSAYNDGTILIYPATDSCRYTVVGTEDGVYGFCVIRATKEGVLTFTTTDTPISANAIHEYAVDWDALAQGNKGVTVQIDSNGDGTIDKSITVGAELSHDEFLSATAKEEGLPSWIWIVVGAGAAAVAGAGILTYFLRRRPRAQN